MHRRGMQGCHMGVGPEEHLALSAGLWGEGWQEHIALGGLCGTEWAGKRYVFWTMTGGKGQGEAEKAGSWEFCKSSRFFSVLRQSAL